MNNVQCIWTSCLANAPSAWMGNYLLLSCFYFTAFLAQALLGPQLLDSRVQVLPILFVLSRVSLMQNWLLKIYSVWFLCLKFGGKYLITKNLFICKVGLRTCFSQSRLEDFCEVSFLPLGGLGSHRVPKLLPGEVLIKNAWHYFFPPRTGWWGLFLQPLSVRHRWSKFTAH